MQTFENKYLLLTKHIFDANQQQFFEDLFINQKNKALQNPLTVIVHPFVNQQEFLFNLIINAYFNEQNIYLTSIIANQIHSPSSSINNELISQDLTNEIYQSQIWIKSAHYYLKYFMKYFNINSKTTNVFNHISLERAGAHLKQTIISPDERAKCDVALKIFALVQTAITKSNQNQQLITTFNNTYGFEKINFQSEHFYEQVLNSDWDLTPDEDYLVNDYPLQQVVTILLFTHHHFFQTARSKIIIDHGSDKKIFVNVYPKSFTAFKPLQNIPSQQQVKIKIFSQFAYKHTSSLMPLIYHFQANTMAMNPQLVNFYQLVTNQKLSLPDQLGQFQLRRALLAIQIFTTNDDFKTIINNLFRQAVTINRHRLPSLPTKIHLLNLDLNNKYTLFEHLSQLVEKIKHVDFNNFDRFDIRNDQHINFQAEYFHLINQDYQTNLYAIIDRLIKVHQIDILNDDYQHLDHYRQQNPDDIYFINYDYQHKIYLLEMIKLLIAIKYRHVEISPYFFYYNLYQPIEHLIVNGKVDQQDLKKIVHIQTINSLLFINPQNQSLINFIDHIKQTYQNLDCPSNATPHPSLLVINPNLKPSANYDGFETKQAIFYKIVNDKWNRDDLPYYLMKQQNPEHLCLITNQQLTNVQNLTTINQSDKLFKNVQRKQKQWANLNQPK